MRFRAAAAVAFASMLCGELLAQSNPFTNYKGIKGGRGPIQRDPVSVPRCSETSELPSSRDSKPRFSGTVRMVVFSGESVDFARIQAALKCVPGAAHVAQKGRFLEIGFDGPWSDLKKLEFAAAEIGLPAEIASPARVVFRPETALEDPSKALAALKELPGVAYAERNGSDLLIYGDLSTMGMDSIRSTLGVRGQVTSHEEIKVAFSGSGDASILEQELEGTKWVLRAEIRDSLWVLSSKGRVTKALVRSVLAKNGFSPAK